MNFTSDYEPSTWKWVADQVELYEASGGAKGNTQLANSMIKMQDGPEPFETSVRQIDGDEYDQWWERTVAVYPPYDEYQAKTTRKIPVFVTAPR